jgi:hypothetical protein
MARVVFVLGLCGAGKSTRASALEAEGFVNLDEKSTGRSVHPEWPTSAYPDLLEAVAKGRNCVVTDIWFLEPDAQERVTCDLTKACPEVSFEWECFDPADLELANQNCRRDPSRTPEGIEANLQQNDRMIACLRNGTLKLPQQARLLKTARL